MALLLGILPLVADQRGGSFFAGLDRRPAAPEVGPGAKSPVVRTLRVVGAVSKPRGAAPRGAPPTPAGEPDFLWRKSEERTPGRKRFFLPGPTFSSLGRPCGGPPSFFTWPAAHLSYARNGPPPSWAGWEGVGVVVGKGRTHPQSLPLGGEGAPVRTLGRMRGRPCTQPFLVEKGRSTACRLDEVVLLPRWASRSPPHQSPSVTASPQGEAFAGGTPPQQNAFSPRSCSRKMRIQIRARRWAPK